MPYLIQRGSADRPLLFLLVQSGDHITGIAGAAPAVAVSKNGAAFAGPAGAVSEVGNGWYKVAPHASDSDTLGPLLLHATAAGADPCDAFFEVVGFDPSDPVRLGLSALPGAAAGAAGGLLTDKDGYALSGAGLDAVAVEQGLNARQALAVIAAEAAGNWTSSGGTAVFAGAGVAAARISGSYGPGSRVSNITPPP